MDEVTYTTGVTRKQSTPATLESMIEAVEQISKSLPACWHHDLITSEWLPKSASGTTYVCTQCFELFTAPVSLFPIGEAPKRLSIDFFRGGSRP